VPWERKKAASYAIAPRPPSTPVAASIAVTWSDRHVVVDDERPTAQQSCTPLISSVFHEIPPSICLRVGPFSARTPDGSRVWPAFCRPLMRWSTAASPTP
jgi:hypothetical protein